MQKPAQSKFWLFAVIAIFVELSVSQAAAQIYPDKPIRMLVGLSPGGSTDVSARLVAQKLTEYLGQAVIVENRTGAGGSIAIERAVSSPPDGYTLLMAPASTAILPSLRSKLPYDIERDLAPISLVVTGPYVLVIHPSVPARNIAELIGLARSQPGKLSYGSDGVGSALYLAGELFKLMAKLDIVHVPYKGGAESAIANAAGQVDISFPSLTSSRPLIGTGKLKPLAVTTIKRTALAPSLPTLDESGLPGYNRSGWVGLLAPAAVPKNIITRLNMAVVKVVNTPEMKEALNKQGQDPQTNSPEQFAAFIRGEIEQNANLIKLTGVKAD
ncbi:MAG: tripartite tricarboxylate transporter substrate binding protein [Betaproteobacteria bacterium]|nr:tripartite tricarboxylate transporter substrate binding protein [Betaproteobacteria bacterium]